MAYNPATAAALIRSIAPQYGVDPDAAFKVATVEGLSGGIGDQGTSFGPFQLHVGGALPKGITNPQAWASGPAGISYAIQRMAAAGARGLTGGAAVNAIVRNFEVPANPDAEVARALGTSYTPGPAYAGGPTPMAGGGGGPDPRAAFVLGLSQASAIPQGPARTAALLQNLLQLRNNSGGSTGGSVQSTPVATATGLNPDFAARLRGLEKASGVSVTSGFRSTTEQAALWNAALKKYGSAAAARQWVAPPGASNHNKGLAADLSGNLALAHKLAPQFGLTFPLSNEAWHVEPAGLRG